MNYRHHFHAGNFADVMKHVLVVRLLRELQKKERGILFLDTHAGRASHDLERAATGDWLAREPEWPDGVGRLWSEPEEEMPAALQDYLRIVREFDRRAGNLGRTPRFYPGSPSLACRLARPIDRLVFCERQPAEFAALRREAGSRPRVSLHEQDGYDAIRAMLPPPERRALVLIDPPFEAQDEFERIAAALEAGLQRFRSGVFAIWHPVTVRARAAGFLAAVAALNPPSALAIELGVAGDTSAPGLKACGLLMINPPWRFDAAARAIVEYLARVLAREPGGGSRVEWLVRGR
jgi:23S rRNA (adenine2030-N6)-methyltransferase